MMQLEWLPPHHDAAAALRDARILGDPAARLRAAIALAGHRRDFLLTNRIDQLAAPAITVLQDMDRLEGLRPYRVALLASHSVEHLPPAIRVAGLQRGLALTLHVAPYGQYRQSLLGEDGELSAFAPQMIVFALDALDTPILLPLTASEEEVAAAVDRRVEELRQLWRRAAERFDAAVVQQTLLSDDLPVFGSLDLLIPAAPAAILHRLNHAIRDAARKDGMLLLDMGWCKTLAGQEVRLTDPVRWHQAKQLVHPAAAPTYGEVLARLIAASCGLARKCLVVDLDNTLWGGVIGDDGLEGLRLGQGDATGEAFVAFQHYIALLAQRGVILAVCSKNDIAVAEAGFGHQGMILKRAEIAAFVANWDNKATNLRLIARTLQVGIDSLVFVDDNPAERDIVRRELPEVAVPEMPEDIADYPMTLAAAGYFEAVSFTQEDAARGRSYAANAARAVASEKTVDLGGYLRDLGMRMTASRVGPAELPRTVQLLNKTNQFNLTTRRYGEAEFRRMIDQPGMQAWTFRLSDRFGDNGLISVVLVRPDEALDDDELLIDSWVMSCRVLGRHVESAVLATLVEAAREEGAHTLVGEYRPTPRNGMVAAHYQQLGFEPVSRADDDPDGGTWWRYSLSRGVPSGHFIEVVHS